MKRIDLVWLSLLILVGCRTQPENVNSPIQPPLLGLVGVPQGSQAQAGRAPEIAAVTGKVLLKSEFPIPLSKVKLGLFGLDSGKEKLMTEFSSEADGTFQITRPVKKGKYKIQVTDTRYEGGAELNLTEAPVRDLILEVSNRSAKSLK